MRQDRNGARDCWEGGSRQLFAARFPSGSLRSPPGTAQRKALPCCYGRREELAMREWQEIISREHIRRTYKVARPELPWCAMDWASTLKGLRSLSPGL